MNDVPDPTRRERLDRWHQLEPSELQKLPSYDRNYIMGAVEQDAKNQLALRRVSEMDAVCSRRLPKDKEHLAMAAAVIVGALTFSVAPQLLASQGGRGPLALSAGLAGGAAASFFAHANASRALVGSKLKKSTAHVRRTITHG